VLTMQNTRLTEPDCCVNHVNYVVNKQMVSDAICIYLTTDASRRGAQRGAKNFLEFLAGTDHGKTVTKVGSIKAQHLFSHIFMYTLSMIK
jgi:hypothetical protein